MVKQAKKGDKCYYICGECSLIYKSKETAKKCEEWCSRHKSCNTKIMKQAVLL